jgi:manganese-dependent inorganic pyrophosphatase
MRRHVHVIGHKNPDADSVCSAIAYAHLKNVLGDDDVRPARAGALDEETTFILRKFDVPAPELITDAAGRDLILVDHNERAQAVARIDQANILEIWDHHPLGDLRPPYPILFHGEPVGATATLISEQYFLNEVTPTRKMAGLLLAAILSDTILFQSPTTSDKDRRMAARLEPLAAVEANLGDEMLNRKIAATQGESPAEIVRKDYKEFRLGQYKIGIGQVDVGRAGELAERKESIVGAMRMLCREARLTQVILMITAVPDRSSDLWFVGDRRDLFEKAFGRTRDDEVRLRGCVSRKKQIVPRLEIAFAEDERERPHVSP